MKRAAENKLLREFAKSANKDELISDLRMKLRIAGGMPHERLEHSIVLDSSGNVRVRYEDRLKGIGPVTRSGVIDREEALKLVKSVVNGREGLVFESEASFLPHGLTGRLTLEFGGSSETFWFGVADPGDDIEDEIADGYHFAPQLNKARRLFERLSRRVRETRGD